jgi:hypothetical protein
VIAMISAERMKSVLMALATLFILARMLVQRQFVAPPGSIDIHAPPWLTTKSHI